MELVALALLLLLVSSGSGRFTPWAPGKEYVYQLKAASLTDIPELIPNTNFRLEYDAHLRIHARGFNGIIVELINVTARSYRQEDKSDIGTPVSIYGRMYLEKPFAIQLREGLVHSLNVSKGEPIWSINLKRALASELQLHVSKSLSVESATKNFAFDTNREPSGVFRVVEKGVLGECETLYEIAKLSDALLRSDRRLNAMDHICTSGSYFQRSSISQYIGCGTLENFTLVKQMQRSELRTNARGFESEQVRDFSVMDLALQSVQPIASLTTEADLSETTYSLAFSLGGQTDGKTCLDGGRNPIPILRDVDKTERSFDFAELRFEVGQKIPHLTTLPSTGNNNDTAQSAIDALSSISDRIRLLDYHEIETLVRDITNIQQSDEVTESSRFARSMLLDVIMMAGSNPAVMYLKDAIMKRELSRKEVAQVAPGLLLHIRTPTRALVLELLKLLEWTSLNEDRTIFHVMALAFSKLVYATCINVAHGRFSFAVEFYGNLCSTDDSLVGKKLMPLLASMIQVESAEFNPEEGIVALTALGELGQDFIVPIAVSVIKRKIDYPVPMRAIAVLSLRKLALQSNQRVLDILTGVGQDPFENDRVRIIALVLLVSTNPPAFRWQKIAFSTWFEPSPQVASFTYDILYNLARSDHIDCSLRQLSEKAQVVLSLAKPVPNGFPDRPNLDWSDLILKANAGVDIYSQLFNECESMAPQYFHVWLGGTLSPFPYYGRRDSDEDSFPDVIKEILRIKRILRREKKPFQWQKWISLTNVDIPAPNSLGSLVTTRFRTEAFVTFQGSYIETPSDLHPLNEKLVEGTEQRTDERELDIKVSAIFRKMIEMKVNASFVNHVTFSGVYKHLVTSVPDQWTVDLNQDALDPLFSRKASLSRSFSYAKDSSIVYQYSIDRKLGSDPLFLTPTRK